MIVDRNDPVAPRVVSLEVPKVSNLGSSNRLQPDGACGGSSGYSPSPANIRRAEYAMSQDPARMPKDDWGAFVKRPTTGLDNTHDKRIWNRPLCKYAAEGGRMRNNGRCKPACLQTNLESSKDVKAAQGQAHQASGPVDNGLRSPTAQSRAGRLWQKYFRDPADWWDNRQDKLHSKSPDFRHKSTNEALWIDKRSTPKWVTQALETRIPSSNSGEGCVALPCRLDLNEFSWTAIMSQRIKCGQGRQALQIYDDMIERGIKPSSYTFVAALKASSSLHDLESAKYIHAEVVKSGFKSSVFVSNMLVAVYAKCGDVAGARCIFETITHRNVVSWNAMILGYTQIQQAEEALHLYKRMQEEGITPDNRTFVGVIKGCSVLAMIGQDGRADRKVMERCLEQVRAIHSDILKAGPVLDIYVGNMLVDAYAKCGSLPDSRHVFDNMPHRNVVSWTAMVMGYVQREQGEVALQLYSQMQQQGVTPNARTFVGALKACSSLAASEKGNEADGPLLNRRCLEQVRVIHSDIVNSGSESDVFVGTMLVDVYAKCGSLLEARRIFEKMPNRNVVSWTAMILGYAQMDEGGEALHLYTRMQQEGVVPNDRTFVAALKACSSLAISQERNEVAERLLRERCLKQVRAIHSEVKKTGSHSDIFVGTMLVDVYAKCGSLADARTVFEEMPGRDAISWNAMISGYSQMEAGEEALQLYARMQQEGLVPDERTFVGALKACGSLARLEKGKGIHAQISKTGLESTDSFVASSLIDMYAKCGSMVDAQQAFDAVRTRDIVTWSALIAGYARQGESQIVFDLFETMRRQGILPNSVTFLSLLSVCSHGGLVEKGQKYFDSMSKDYGISPSINHYTCMVDLLGRVGYVDKAMALVRTMPSPPDGAVWEALLGACRKWNNVELGRQAFECAVRLDESDPAPYVLMSNIYAAAHMWKEAQEIQARRVKTGAWKQPGQSWSTDGSGVTYAFGATNGEQAQTQMDGSLVRLRTLTHW